MITSLAGVEKAIAAAQHTAQEKGVPLTLERLAVAMDCDVDTLLTFMRRHKPAPDTPAKAWSPEQKRAARLWAAAALCEAELAEHALVKGHSATMPLYLLRRVHDGGTDGGEADGATVVFTGEEAIAE